MWVIQDWLLDQLKKIIWQRCSLSVQLQECPSWGVSFRETIIGEISCDLDVVGTFSTEVTNGYKYSRLPSLESSKHSNCGVSEAIHLAGTKAASNFAIVWGLQGEGLRKEVNCANHLLLNVFRIFRQVYQKCLYNERKVAGAGWGVKIWCGVRLNF